MNARSCEQHEEILLDIFRILSSKKVKEDCMCKIFFQCLWSLLRLRCTFLNSNHIILPFHDLESAIMTAIGQKLYMKKSLFKLNIFKANSSFKTAQALQILTSTKLNKINLQILHNNLKPLLSFFHPSVAVDIAMQICVPHTYFNLALCENGCDPWL